MIKRKDVLTTGEVAQICRVAPRTVTKWFDSGQLKGYRIPGSRDRRIPAGELIRFMKAHDMPTDELEKGHIRILLIDSRVEVARQFAHELQSKGSFDVQIAHNSFDAGLMAQKLRPTIILIDLMSPEIDAHDLCTYVRESGELKDCCVIALAGGLSETETDSLLKKGFGGIITEPGNMNKVLACIQEKCSVIYG
jgi:excisionase family DNA binding protein